MEGFSKSAGPEYRIREMEADHFVIDVHWPYGAVEQLVGVFASREQAAQWLVKDRKRSHF